MNKEQIENDEKILNKFLIFSILFVLAVFFLTPIFIISIYGKMPENPGAFGDMFGVVNALFTSLAFTLLIYTSMMQRIELKLQRKELELTRKEFEKSVKAQQDLVKIQEKTMQVKKIERDGKIKPMIKDSKLLYSKREEDDFEIVFHLFNGSMNLLHYKISSRNGEELFRKKIERIFHPNNNIIITWPKSIPIEGNLQILLVYYDEDSNGYNQTLRIIDNNVEIGLAKLISKFDMIKHLNNLNV